MYRVVFSVEKHKYQLDFYRSYTVGCFSLKKLSLSSLIYSLFDFALIVM